jgi:hypothetical protein
MRGLAVLVLATACSLGGCRREEPAAPMERTTFVEVMVSLRRAALQSSSQEDFESRKQAILREARVTEDQLRAYARLGARDGPALADAYDTISARLQRYQEPE